MKQQQAIHILMLSPCYWLLNLSARKELIREFCASYEKLSQKDDEKAGKEELPPLT